MRETEERSSVSSFPLPLSFSLAVFLAMKQQFIIFYILLVTSVTVVFSVLNENSLSTTKPSIQVEKLPWKSHFEFQSPTEYYDEHDSDHDEFIERRNPGPLTSSNSLCPPGETGQFPYIPDCRRFINCWKGRSSIQVCAPATLFNPETRECDHPGKVECKNKYYEETFSPESERYVRFPHQRPAIAHNTRVARYQNNDKTIPAKPYPGPPPYFGPSHLKPPTRPTNQPVASKLSRPNCPAGATGIFPHPNDCSKFLKCWSGGTFIQNCGPGTLFNPRISACDHPHNVACSHDQSHSLEETPDANTDVQEPEETVKNEKFVVFKKDEMRKSKETEELKSNEEPSNPIKVATISSTPKYDMNGDQDYDGIKVTTLQRHPKIINVGTKDKPSSVVANGVSSYLTPPQNVALGSQKFQSDHFNSQVPRPNQASAKELGTHYPSHGPYSQLYNRNPASQEIQQFSNNPFSSHFSQGSSPHTAHDSYHQRPPSHHHYQQPHHNNVPPTWLQPPPLLQPQPNLYAPSYPQGQDPINVLQKPEPCSNIQIDPYRPSAPICEPNVHYYPFKSQESAVTTYPGFTSSNYPRLPPNHPDTNIPNQAFTASKTQTVSSRVPPSVMGNTPYASAYTPVNIPPPSVQTGSMYNPNVHPLNSPYRPIVTSSTQTKPYSTQNYYPFYVLQVPTQQHPHNNNGYYPQVQFKPMSHHESNVQYSSPENSTHQYRPNHHPDVLTNHDANSHFHHYPISWGSSTFEAEEKGDVGQTSSSFPPRNKFNGNRNSKTPIDNSDTTNQFDINTKVPHGIELESPEHGSIHPSSDEKNQEKDYILNEIDVRTGEEQEEDDSDKRTTHSLKDVENIDVSLNKPDKYSEQEEVKVGSNVTFPPENPPMHSSEKPTAGEPVMKPSANFVKIKQTPPNGQMVRLRNGASHLDGYLEMKNGESQWGLVCDEVGAWSIEEATVACRELGFVRGAELSWQGYPMKSEEEILNVAVEVINCTGSETSLSECQVTRPGAGACNVARNAVGLRCFDNLASHCQPGEILYNRHCYKLHGKENPDDPSIKTEEASDNCRKFGGKLVDITSQYENDFLSEWLIKKYPEINSVVTGGIGISVLGRPMWIWEGTNDPMVFERWWSGWTGSKKIPKGSIKGPLCIVLKKTYACNDTDEEVQREKNQVKETKFEETCSADYFFWDVEDCNDLRTPVYICKRPMDDIGCVIGTGEGYLGTANTTASGQACLPWDHPKVVEGLARRASARERSARLAGHNYCRNLGDPDRHPWCFVEGKGNSEYCAIPQCWDSVSGYHRSYDAFSSCDQNHFECKPGECIKNNWVCDGQKDCSNNRDEDMCKVFYQEFKTFKNKKMRGTGNEKWANVNENTCSKLCLQRKNFKCRSFSYNLKGKFCLLSDTNVGLSGEVINESGWVYHELISDSLHCTMENGFFGCQNGRCINISNVCDGKRNCQDGSDERDCKRLGFELRLSGSKEKHRGRIEVKILGKWGVVCDDMFDLRDANVVCRELGFHMGASEVLQHSYYPVKNPFFLVDDLNCFGNESSIRQCPFSGWGKHNCGPEESVGVVCRVTGSECADGQWRCKTSKECISIDYLCDDIFDCDDKSDENDEFCKSPTQIRLAEGPDGASGRLEIRHFGVWGTVCDDDFNPEAAKVVCRLLGYNGSAEVKKNAYFGAGKGPIWLDEVHCAGHERNLEECAYPHWGRNNCKHDEDVGVICGLDFQKSSTVSPLIASASADESTASKEEKLRKALISECGKKSKNSQAVISYERVVGGTNVARESVPWQASVRVKSGGGKSIHWCGAIVISPYHLLTAGHCLRDYNKAAYFIRVGDYDTEVQDVQEQEFAIDHLYMHSNFSKKVKLNNDIGLVKIKGEIHFSDHVKPACLAPSLDVYRPGTNCTVSGWGSISAHSAGFARTLKWAHIPILEPSICRAPFVYGNSLSEGMFCAGHLDGGVDSCQGDSGGPLTCRHEGIEYLFGITSWGHGCGRVNKPGVYTNIAYYAEWIQEKMELSLM